jgi:excisionase family DNA binding protein
MKNNNDYLNAIEAAEYLGLSINTIYGMTSRRIIRFSKPNGSKIYFAKSDLDAWLSKNTFEALNINKGK